MKANAKTRSEVMKVLRAIGKAYARHSVDEALACFGTDADVTYVGSGDDEVYVGPKKIRAGFERDFAQCESATVTYSQVRASAAGKAAWVVANCVLDVKVGGASLQMPGRLTVVLEQRRGAWLIMQSHFSVANVAQAAGESFSGPPAETHAPAAPQPTA